MRELRYYQRNAIENTYDWLRSNDGNPLISMATGTGKSTVIAKICEDAMQYENQHVIICTHSKELVKQDHEELYELCPEIHAGIYCAGWGKKQIRPITFASIQSICRIKETPYCQLLMIDEAQLVNDGKESSMYVQFIERLKLVNPDLRAIGLSATPYRVGSGMLCEGEGRLFHGVSYEYTIAQGVKDGYLAPLISKASLVQGDTSKIGITAGEYNLKQAENEFDRNALTEAALDEVFKYGADRRAWLFFCITVDHANHVRDALRARGITAESVSDKTPEMERNRILNDYKAGHVRALTNVNIAAVGFNAPRVDLIATLRPTLSPGWHVQALGRGTRLFPGKENCLVLDFTSNLASIGPVTHVQPPKRGKRISPDDQAGRICPKCQSVNERGATECGDCGHVFPIVERKLKHTRSASNVHAMSDEPVISSTPQWLKVQAVHYDVHTKYGGSDSLKVMYKTEAQWVYSWVCFGHAKDFPRRKASEWWIARGGRQPVPPTARDAMVRLAEVSGFKTQRIRVKKNGKFDEIVAWDLVPSQTNLRVESGNLGTTVTQENEDVAATAEAV